MMNLALGYLPARSEDVTHAQPLGEYRCKIVTAVRRLELLRSD
jgi:hypothetical protein